jgi:hypothetical protein
VALQAVGGAMGNMICVHNVVAALATVGPGRDRRAYHSPYPRSDDFITAFWPARLACSSRMSFLLEYFNVIFGQKPSFLKKTRFLYVSMTIVFV